jgi:hypothetical protein
MDGNHIASLIYSTFYEIIKHVFGNWDFWSSAKKLIACWIKEICPINKDQLTKRLPPAILPIAAVKDVHDFQ